MKTMLSEVTNGLNELQAAIRTKLTHIATVLSKLPMAKVASAQKQVIAKDFADVKADLNGASKKISTISTRLEKERLGRRFAEEIKEVADESYDILQDAQDAIDQAQTLINPEKAKEEGKDKGKEKGKPEVEGEGLPWEEGMGELEETPGEDESAPEKGETKEMEEAEQVVSTVRKWKKGLAAVHDIVATAIPPTGANDSGDKVAADGDPAEIELRHWQDGNQQGNKDIAKDKENTNPANDARLTDEGNPANNKPYINASLLKSKKLGGTSWVVSRNGRPTFAVSFQDACTAGDGKEAATKENFSYFTSSAYKKDLIASVNSEGFEAVRADVGGRFITAEDAMDPEFNTSGHAGVDTEGGKDINEQGYFAEAYGDSGFASDLTKDYTKGGTVKNHATLAAENSVLKKTLAEERKKTANKAKAQRAIELARLKASRGLIPFTKEAVTASAKETLAFTDTTYSQVYAEVCKMPMKYAQALYKKELTAANEASDEMTAPESGVVGNPLQGVRSKGKGDTAYVDTEDMPNDVKNDARIASSARRAIQDLTSSDKAAVRDAVRSGVIPQMTKSASELQGNDVMDRLANVWNTTRNRLLKRGVDNPDKYRGAQYKNR